MTDDGTDVGRGLRPTRRDVLRTGAGAGAVVLAGLAAPAVRAADATLRIGFVSPQTGPLAAFGAADPFVLDGVRAALADGLSIDGRTYRVEVIARDSQSNPNRVAEVASGLILDDEVDILVASSTGDTVNPAADQCEVEGIPCVTTDAPWEAYFFGRGGRPDAGFAWTYHFFWGLGDLMGVFADMWSTADTNRRVGALLANDVEGNALADPVLGIPRPIGEAGFALTLPGLQTPLADDYSAAVSAFKAAGVEILTGAVVPPDFATFWTQAAQQGLRRQLKFATIAKAMLFPAAVEAIGDAAVGVTTEVWWSPAHPYRSSLTGQSAAAFAAAYTEATGRQWTQPMGFKHAVLEVAVDALRRSGDPKDRGAVRDALAATRLDTLVGAVDWTTGGARNPVKNVCTTPLVGGQWKKGAAFPYELAIVDNRRAPEIPLSGDLVLLS